jgi:hypothetical protein
MDELLKQARATHEIKKAYGDAFCKNKWALKPLDTEAFWVVINSFRDNLVSGLAAGRRVESEVHNLMCSYIHGTYGQPSVDGWPEEKLARWENMVRFLVKYEEVRDTLSKKMYDMKGLEDRGGDGYGDLMDSMPLAGREVVDGVMNDDIANYKQLEKALAEHPLKGFVLNGENYVRMTLEKVLKEQLPDILACMDYDEREERERPVEPHVVMIVEPLMVKYTYREEPSGVAVKVRGPFNSEQEADEFARQSGQGIVARLFEGIVKR